MKCVLTFPVHGRLRIKPSLPILIRGTTYELATASDGTVTDLRATVSVPDKSQWPTIKQGPPHILKGVYPPVYAFIHLELRVIQGILSFFGLERIDLDAPEARWLPENEEEKRVLKVHTFSKSRGRAIEDLNQHHTPFDVVARAFLASDDLREWEKPLSFYRNGKLDLINERYIDAVYDFFYVLELLFAPGVSGTHAVVKKFLKAAELKEAVEHTKEEPPIEVLNKPDFRRRFDELFANYDLAKVYEKLVLIRGGLHHANDRGPKAWHPDHQSPYRFEALIFADIASNVLFASVLQTIDSEHIVKQFRTTFMSTPQT